MKMTRKEYEELIKNLEFLSDKIETCYKNETDNFLKQLKKEYKKFIVDK